MAISQSQMNAVKKYMNKAYYRPSVMLKREYEEDIRNRAKELNLSMSEYIQTLIKKDLDEKIL